jgi:hypothetical protein
MKLYLQALGTHQLDAGAPIECATPIAPKNWGRSDGEGMEQETDLAWLRGVAALPLTLFTQRTGTATADAGPIHKAQTPVDFPPPLL